MKCIEEDKSARAHVAWASFTWVSLLAWSGMVDLPEATRVSLREMADALKGMIDALLLEARAREDQEMIQRPSAQAHQAACVEMATARLTEALALVRLRVGDGSRDHPLVREFLPLLAKGVTEAPVSERPRRLLEAANRLVGLRADFAEKPVQVERLRAAATALQAAIAANEAAWAAWSGERSSEVVAKRRLRLEMDRVHGRLRALFPGRRGLVESLFRKSPRRTAGSADGDEGATTPGGSTSNDAAPVPASGTVPPAPSTSVPPVAA